MSYYLHQTPGRLRVRAPAFRGSEQLAAQAVRLLAGVRGVQRIASNATTGSITIVYHAHELCPSRLINLLAEHGFLPGVIGFPVKSRRPPC